MYLHVDMVAVLVNTGIRYLFVKISVCFNISFNVAGPGVSSCLVSAQCTNDDCI